MLWIFLAILAYALFAVVAMGDKYLLSDRLPHPLLYGFYVGVLGGLTIVPTLVFGFPVPARGGLLLALISGGMFIAALLTYYRGLHTYEASRIVPAIGGFLPIVSAGLSFIFFPGIRFGAADILALLLLVSGSIVITAKNIKGIFSDSFRIAFLGAFLLALSFVTAKYVYLSQSFWSGFLWMRIGGLVAALVIFMLSREVRRGVFWHRRALAPRFRESRITTAFLFLGNQSMGAAAMVLQNIAIYAAPPAAIALVNALQGTQYLFLILFVYIASSEFPALYHESFSRKSFLEKLAGALLLGAGTAILIFSQS